MTRGFVLFVVNCLFLIDKQSDGSYDTRLVAAEEGPVHAAIWSPSTLEFAVCYGKVPATVRSCLRNSCRSSLPCDWPYLIYIYIRYTTCAVYIYYYTYTTGAPCHAKNFLSWASLRVPQVAVYDGSGKVSSPKFCLGQGMRTTLQFCPFAKLLLWGGFGNLAGEVEVWSPRKKGIVGKTVVSLILLP